MKSKYDSIRRQVKPCMKVYKLAVDLASRTGGNLIGFRAYLRDLGYKTFLEDNGKIVCWQK